ncbi:CaiF/GrlA family transcriptional regulator [Citrobacter sp. wls713]|uniref:CaiF/GrlA family transcriptional regulator n=1 Tax=Citrobacter TaxID=544 RepID=UPI0010C98A32|nr:MULTISPECIES: CaiF/GrlA family transcriptional regulator [unclassified Citrobacter]TKU63908.1 CaiF/GrlA family transcriptional regulator [Citrobacter sp. wls713]TKU98791.1 CaiF/GrlA family transcriptional regulator [Citrobacter sp. wls621]
MRRIKRHFFCPECVRDMQSQPLYIIVAFWGMRTGRLLTMEVVSREFHIPQRVAKDILHYIEHEGRNHICSRRFIQNEPTTGRRCALRILDVQDPQEIPASSGAKLDLLSEAAAPAVKQQLRPVTKFQQLRQWMLSRKQNEQPPQGLIENG